MMWIWFKQRNLGYSRVVYFPPNGGIWYDIYETNPTTGWALLPVRQLIGETIGLDGIE